MNNLTSRFGGQPIFFPGKPELFKPLYVASGIWQGTGWRAIIYIAALSGISLDICEAARIDGDDTVQADGRGFPAKHAAAEAPSGSPRGAFS